MPPEHSPTQTEYPDTIRPSGAKWLLVTRSVRSVGQGILVVDFSLYLNALGWQAESIGLLLGASLVLAIVATVVVGPLSDRLGRKRFLIGYELVTLLCALAALSSSRAWVLVLAAVLSGFGRGQNGAAGPFGPVEQAWLATHAPPRKRGRLYSLNTALGAFGMALGSVLAAMPHWLRDSLPGAEAYRPVFAVVAVTSVAALIFLSRLDDETRPTSESSDADASEPVSTDPDRLKKENFLLTRLMFANFLNGAGIGLISPLIAYWFYLRFDVGPAALAPMMGAAFLLAGLSALGTGWISAHVGVVRAVVWLRLTGLILLLAMPFMPLFRWAALLYIVRAGCNMGTIGARQALNVSLVQAERRGMATSLASVSLQVPRAVGPMISGLMLGAGWLVVPFLLAAGFQGAYLAVYQRSFRKHDPSLQ